MARIYKPSAIYDARVASTRNLWEPSTEYQGRAVDKPNYLVTIIIKKTRQHWHEEPALADFAKSCNDLYQAAMTHVPFASVDWPIKDGDAPDNMGRAPVEWRRGNWILNGSSTSPIEVSINQGGVTVPLKNRGDVKNGDHVMVTTSVAQKFNDPKGVKTYINKVVFMGPGEEIVMGNSVSTAELMEKAKAQGMNVTGYGGGGTPQTGFGEGFSTRQAPPNTPVQAPFPGNGPQQGLAPAPISPPAQQGFAPPSGFNVPTGFPPRS